MMGRRGSLRSRCSTPFGLRIGFLRIICRRIDRVLDLSDLHGQLAAFYSHTGRCKSRSNNPSLKRPIGLAAPEQNCGS